MTTRTMGLDRRKVVVFASAALIRLFLFAAFPSLPNLLTGRVEISTPVSSFKRLQEGVFLYTENVSPYDGGVFHQPPLLLPITAPFLNASNLPLITDILYIIMDLITANALMRIAHVADSTSTELFPSERRNIRWSSVSLGAAFLFNPFTIATCLARSPSVFTNWAILYAIERAVSGDTLTSMVALSLASYLSLYPILLLPPLILLCFDRQKKIKKTSHNVLDFAMSSFGIVTSVIMALLYLSYVITGGSWEFLSSTYGFQLLLPDLTPNVGLWWYFFIEMFDSFRNFFLGVFWLHLGGYVAGLRLFAIFKPYPSISDTSLYLGVLPLYSHIFPCKFDRSQDLGIHYSETTLFKNNCAKNNLSLVMRYTFFAVSTLLYATLLGPAFYYLWIYAGSGNANFFYAITLVWSLGLTVLLADSIFAVLKDEWEVERPEMKGKEVTQI
ncbi:MAG: hypothetical protein M1816_001331 [Peltula sp. TS41687]|nr:MAG: hypothetical protein M1816_001331 [Peltula sp. TS41687]